MRLIGGLVLAGLMTASVQAAITFPSVPKIPALPRIGTLQLDPQYWRWMVESGQRHGVDPYLIVAVAAIESRFDPEATSGHGACIGLMQLHRDTARSLGVDPWDPRQNIDGGTRVLARLLQKSGGDLRRVFKHYNASFNEGYFREIVKAYHQARRAE